MTRLLPDDSPRTIAIACGLGAASSSCSYAAVALARSIFRKGADFTASMAFQFASTNLVIELGILLALLLGWQFTLAEFVGGPIMIALIAVAFRLTLKAPLVGGGAGPGRPRDRGLDGGPRGDGHVGDGRLDREPADLAARLHRDQPLLRDGLGGDLARHRRRAADRRRARGVGPDQLLAVVLPGRPPDAGEDLGAAGRDRSSR